MRSGAGFPLLLGTLCACVPGVSAGPDTAALPDVGVPADGDSGGTNGDGPSEPRPCSLTTDLATPHWWEGDRIAFSVSCRTGASPRDAEVRVANLPEDASFDLDSGLFSWQTGPTDGGRVDLTLTASGTDGPPESTVLTFWVADNPRLAGAVAPDPETYTEEWGLPVIHVETDAALTRSKQPARITVRGESVDGSAKIRGATSSYYPKPGYTLDFEGEELAIDEWEGPSRGHLILTTTFDDNSYVRQKLIYDLWQAMADHQDVARLTPRTFFAVVYLRGAYHGLYMGCDRIDDEFVRHMGFPSGEGNLYKAVSHDANLRLTDASGRPKSRLSAGYEKPEGLPADDYSDLEALVAEVGGASLSDIASGDAGDLDLDEFMDWFILVSYTLSEDSAGKNSYLYTGEDSEDFRFVPWDFNHSFGQTWRTLRREADTDNDYVQRNRVFEALQADPAASERLWARMAALRSDGPLNPDWLNRQIDGYLETLGPAPQRDEDAWRTAYRSYESWEGIRSGSGDWNNHEGEVEYLRQWLDDRDAFWAARLP